MGQNWAITIGINGYRNLKPLQFAKRDAEAMRDYLCNELGCQPQQVYHFSDDSPPIASDYGPPLDSEPTFGTLRRFLRVRFEQPFLKAGDNLWFFFAGHGVRHEDRDYLLPMDADPGDVASTALPLNYVTERLQRCGADNVILLVDACRSEGRRAGLGVGEERQPGVVSFFACSPQESSYEIEALGQGAFTYALLKGLRLQGEGNCATVERLYHYLTQTVPRLNEAHGKPSQTPYGRIEPPTKNGLILLPSQATLADVKELRYCATNAEVRGNYPLAKQFWIRVLAVSPADPEAIEGIERLSRLSVSSDPSPPPAPPLPPSATPQSTGRGSSRSAQPVPSIQPKPKASPPTLRVSSPRPPAWPSSLSRRRIIQILGFAGGGIGTLWLGRTLLKFFPDLSGGSSPIVSPTSPSSTTSLTPADFNSFEFDVVTVTDRGEIATRGTKRAYTFRETIGNSFIDLVAIPGGTFTMGSPSLDTELDRENNEGPQREVTVPPFLMGKYAVTQAQWRVVAGLRKVARVLNADPSGFKGANRPVERVSWDDAVEFCQRLTQETGREYRLPSEAEWEYACRAGTITPFHFGKTITTDLANYKGQSSYGAGPEGEYREQTTEVGKFPANAFGLYDVHGNVWEWCEDVWHDNYIGAPMNGSAWVAGGNVNIHLLRGGAWISPPERCRSAYRGWDKSNFRESYIGFRIVCVASWTL